jgi:hypothetical protein
MKLFSLELTPQLRVRFCFLRYSHQSILHIIYSTALSGIQTVWRRMLVWSKWCGRNNLCIIWDNIQAFACVTETYTCHFSRCLQRDRNMSRYLGIPHPLIAEGHNFHHLRKTICVTVCMCVCMYVHIFKKNLIEHQLFTRFAYCILF